MLFTAKMSDYSNPQADGNSPALFFDDLYDGDELFDFDAASEEVDHYPYRDFSPVAEDGHFDDLSDDDDGLYDETVSSAKDVDDEELVEEEDGVARADGVLSWKIEHSTGDHKLKGMQEDSRTLELQLTLHSQELHCENGIPGLRRAASIGDAPPPLYNGLWESTVWI